MNRSRRVPVATVRLATALNLAGFDPLAPRPLRKGATLAARCLAVARDLKAEGAPREASELAADAADVLSRLASEFRSAAAHLQPAAPGIQVVGHRNVVAGGNATVRR